MGKEFSTKRSRIQTVSRNPIDNNSPKKGYKSLYNIDKRDQQITREIQETRRYKC